MVILVILSLDQATFYDTLVQLIIVLVEQQVGGFTFAE